MAILLSKDVPPHTSSVSKDKSHYASCTSGEIRMAPKKTPDRSLPTTWWIIIKVDLCCLLSNEAAKAAEDKPHINVGTAVHQKQAKTQSRSLRRHVHPASRRARGRRSNGQAAARVTKKCMFIS